MNKQRKMLRERLLRSGDFGFALGVYDALTAKLRQK